jgi:hypothetical protein
MLSRGLIVADKAVEYFEAIASKLYRYPAVDAATFRRSVMDVFGSTESRG